MEKNFYIHYFIDIEQKLLVACTTIKQSFFEDVFAQKSSQPTV